MTVQTAACPPRFQNEMPHSRRVCIRLHVPKRNPRAWCDLVCLPIMSCRLILAAFLLLAHCSSGLSDPASAADCENAYRSAMQHGDASSVAVLDECALHHRSVKLLRSLALVHAQHPSPASVAKVQQLLLMLPSDQVLLSAAAAVYRRSGQVLWAALAISQAALAHKGASNQVAHKHVTEAAEHWDVLQANNAAHAQLSAIAQCCNNQQPSPSCSRHFVESPKFIAMYCFLLPLLTPSSPPPPPSSPHAPPAAHCRPCRSFAP